MAPAPVDKEEDGEPFADVLHQHAAGWAPVCEHDLEHTEDRQRKGAVIPRPRADIYDAPATLT